MPDLEYAKELLTKSDLNLERSLLAALALDPSAYYAVKSLLTPDVFTVKETLHAYNEITSAYEENRPMPKLEEWDPIGDAVEAARTLFEYWQKRQLARLPRNLEKDLVRDDLTSDAILTRMQSEINRVQALMRDQRSDKALSVSTLFSEVLLDVERRRGEGFGMSTGLARMDNMLGGLQPALHLMAGSPGLGKTTLCLQIGSKVAQQGIPVLYVTFDEVLWRLTLKAFCQMSGLTMKKYADGKFNDDEYEQLKDTYERYKDILANLHMVEGSSRLEAATLESLARQAMRRHSKANTCLIIIDYLQRWASLRQRTGEFGHIVATLVGELREMAFRLDAPVLVISSLTREGYDDPTIKDLKESGELEFSADTALLLRENIRGTERMRHLEDSLSPRALRLNVAKNRYGELGEIAMMFDLQKGVITEKA